MKLNGDQIDSAGTIVTRNLDLAAVFRFFEMELERLNPAIIVEEIKYSDLRKGIKPKVPPRRVTWKFRPKKLAFDIASAFRNDNAHRDFDAYVDNLCTLDDEQKKTLKTLHSISVARAGAELMEKRQELIAIKNSAPDAAVWQAIVRDDGRYKCIFGKMAPAEVKAAFLERE